MSIADRVRARVSFYQKTSLPFPVALPVLAGAPGGSGGGESRAGSADGAARPGEPRPDAGQDVSGPGGGNVQVRRLLLL